MKARRLIERSNFGPETLTILYEAFDSAWAEIAPNFDANDPKQIERARIRLAHAILVVASEDGNDPSALRRSARQIMGLAYKG